MSSRQTCRRELAPTVTNDVMCGFVEGGYVQLGERPITMSNRLIDGIYEALFSFGNWLFNCLTY
jgi:hypothetical protein